MKMLVESLKRMYKKGTLTKEQISERVAKAQATQAVRLLLPVQEWDWKRLSLQ